MTSTCSFLCSGVSLLLLCGGSVFEHFGNLLPVSKGIRWRVTTQSPGQKQDTEAVGTNSGVGRLLHIWAPPPAASETLGAFSEPQFPRL